MGRDAGLSLTAWMVHHATQVICACMVGADGLTPFRRSKGRKFGTPLAGFGERVWFRDPVSNKFNPRCMDPFWATDLESTSAEFTCSRGLEEKSISLRNVISRSKS